MYFLHFFSSFHLQMLKLSDDAKQLLRGQRQVYQFLYQELEKNSSNIVDKAEDYFVCQLLIKTDIAKIINEKAGFTQKYSFEYQMQYEKFDISVETAEQIGILLGKDFILSDSTYQDFITLLNDKVQQLSQMEGFSQVQDVDTEGFTETQQETKLAINLIPGSLMIEDINKTDDDTIWTSLKKLWPILCCIALCGAALGIVLINAPLAIQQQLGGSGMMVTLYQASFSFAQLFGSPFCHWLSEKWGYKTVYSLVYACYTITMGLLSLATIEKMGSQSSALVFIYIMRILQGFMGVSQPLGFSMLSASISPRLRSYASAMNNVAYYVGALLGTVINAFIAPAAGWYTKSGDVTTYVNSMYICCVLSGLAFLFSLFVKECNPVTLLKRACKKNGVKYVPSKQAQCTWGEAFKIVFTQQNLILSFFGLVLGLGNSISNMNIATMMISKAMHFYDTVSAQQFASIMAMVGVLVCALFAFTLYQPCLKYFGLMIVVAVSCWLAAVCSILRSTAVPLNSGVIFVSAILNQFGQILIDAPFISIVSTYTNSYNKARVMGVYQLSNSVARSILTFLAGVLFDWHNRNCQYCFTYFAMAAAVIAAFIKQPVNVKFA